MVRFTPLVQFDKNYVRIMRQIISYITDYLKGELIELVVNSIG